MLMTSCFVCATLNLGRKKSTGTEPKPKPGRGRGEVGGSRGKMFRDYAGEGADNAI